MFPTRITVVFRLGRDFVERKIVDQLQIEIYSCFEKGCPTKPYATMPKDIIGNGGSWSLIDALGVSTTWRETMQTYEFMPYLFLLVNTVNLNQRQPLSTHNTNRHCRVRFYAFVGQPLSKQLQAARPQRGIPVVA